MMNSARRGRLLAVLLAALLVVLAPAAQVFGAQATPTSDGPRVVGPADDPCLLVLETGTPTAEPPAATRPGTPTAMSADRDAVSALVDWTSLADALRERGLAVARLGSVRQPFLRAERGDVLRVSGGDVDGSAEVQVHAYADPAPAARDAARIDREGQPHGMRISWLADPHFYRQGCLVVLYVGTDRAVVDLLTELLGPPFAGQ